MIKLLHFSDFHMGADSRGSIDKETRLPGRIMDFLDSLDTLVDFAVSEDVDIVVFSGDAYHQHSPNPTYQREFGERIVKLAEQCPVVLLVGNHDMPGSVDRASAIDIFGTLKVRNVIVGLDYEVHKIDTKHGYIQVATYPYPYRHAFLSPKEMKAENADDLYKERLIDMVAELESMVCEDAPAVFLGHFSVSEAMFGSEQSMTIGSSAGIPVDILKGERWSYVALGHLHYHQCLSTVEEVPIVYAGSLDRVDFSEENDDKGFVYVSIYDEDGLYPAEWEFISVDPRPFKTLHIDATSAHNVTKKVLSVISKRNLRSCVVRLIVSATDDNAGTYVGNMIEEALKKAGAYLVHNMKLDIQHDIRTRFVLDAGEDITTYSHLDLLDVYFQGLGMDDSKIDSLLELAANVIEDVNNVQK